LRDVSQEGVNFTVPYDAVVVGGAVYVGQIKAAKWLIKHISSIPMTTSVFFFSVGQTNPKDVATVEKIWS